MAACLGAQESAHRAAASPGEPLWAERLGNLQVAQRLLDASQLERPDAVTARRAALAVASESWEHRAPMAVVQRAHSAARSPRPQSALLLGVLLAPLPVPLASGKQQAAA